MVNPVWRWYFHQFSKVLLGSRKRKTEPGKPRLRMHLEELESRLAPATFAVNSHLEVSHLDHGGNLAGRAHGVVFFESAVADYQVLRQGLALGLDAVTLDSGGDGLREMAAFLAGRHDLSVVGLVTHGSPGALSLGTVTLDAQSLGNYARELAIIGSALGPGGELDLWSCSIAAGQGGLSLVRDLGAAIGGGVASADHTVGSAKLGGNWQLDVKVGGARGDVPFSAGSLGAFHELLGSWFPAPSMALARYYDTATLLGNGQVLIAGGFNPVNTGAFPPSAELYDPVHNTWSIAASMLTPRAHHTATLLPNGLVLVTGGLGGNIGNPLASAELYDPVHNIWSSAGSMSSPRFDQTATLLANGKVLITGGYFNGVLASTELYDPALNTWSFAGTMSVPRYQHTATLLGNGKVLVAGGIPNGNTAELFDPISNAWSSAGFMTDARSQHTATLLGNGKVLVAGGGDIPKSTELYDPVTNTWSSAGFMSTARAAHTATLLGNGQVLVAGGFIAGSGDVYSADLFDPVTNTWSATGSMLTGRYEHTATLLRNGSVLATGGYNGGILASAELYDPAGVGPGVAGPFSKFVVTIPGGNTVVAGTSFIITVQATDAYGYPVSSYNGPGSVTITPIPADPKSNFPISGLLNSFGMGYFQGTLDTVGSYTLFATAGSFSGTSDTLNVIPGNPFYFTVAAPASATTGVPMNVAITAHDQQGNVATGFHGLVKLTSTDPSVPIPVISYQFTTGTGQDNGTHTFGVTLNTAGSRTITALDTLSTNPVIMGISDPINMHGLIVTSFTPTATGFTAAFSKQFIPANLTLYGSSLTTVMDVTLFGAHAGPIHGTLLIDPSNLAITYKATANYLELLNSVHSGSVSAVLPDDTYTVKLVSGLGTNGFQDALGAALDGANNAGHANFVTHFTTHYQAHQIPALGTPDIARGPDNSAPITVPHAIAAGIPITLYDAPGVTDVTFTLTYDPSLLNLTGTLSGSSSDATDPGATLTLVFNGNGVATFHYTDPNPVSATPLIPLVLGDIKAVVPNSAAGNYKAKELLQFSAIVINNDPGTFAVSAGGVHVNAYLGDVNGDGVITGVDTVTANQVATGAAPGFDAYQLLDPVVIGDILGDFSVDAANVSAIDAYVVHLQPAQIPVPPTQLPTNNPNYLSPNTIHAPNAADPTLSLAAAPNVFGESMGVSPRVNVSVFLDHPHPTGSTGLTEATLALTYDPTMLSVSPSDITLGSIPNQGTGWQISTTVDQTTGQIGIEIFSLTPINDTRAGTLVNIAFTVLPGARRGVSPPLLPTTTVQLVDTVNPYGRQFTTELADTQGAMILSPGVDWLLV